VRLFTSNADRERFDELATLYGIIVSLDYLEKAYVRDSITQSQSACPPSSFCRRLITSLEPRYTPACSRLLAQFRTIMKLVGDSVPSLDAFMTEYRVRARENEHGGPPGTSEEADGCDADGLYRGGTQDRSGSAGNSRA
jgi:ESCRT-I complex subunit VPS28